MKTNKTISIDTALALDIKRKKNTINVSEICEKALMVAVSFDTPKTSEDVKTRLVKVDAERNNLLMLLEKEKVAQKEIDAKTNKVEFRDDLIKLDTIRKNNPKMFVLARKSLEKKYDLTNAELMKKLLKV